MAKITVHPAYAIGEISPRLYGAFLEPIGTMVNGSMFNPKHPTADEYGFRRDFIEALKESGLPAVRLPGGNFVSGWDWKDSIGPMEKRKAHLDLAWFQYIENNVGHDEYLIWAERVGFEPMYTINLGTGGINDAISIIEYTNHAGGTYWSDLRAKYGHASPYGVKTWYLGNEMDGPWQIASWEKNPEGYGVLANEVSKAMKWVDPTIETVACVSSSPNLDHYPEWDRRVLEECYNAVDYVSLHHYQSAKPGDYAALLGGSRYFEDYINTEIALCDYIQTKMRSPKQMLLSFDEYGTMMRPASEITSYGRRAFAPYKAHYTPKPDRKYVRHDPDNMGPSRFPRMGDMPAALANLSTILALLRHADRVKIGCMTGGLGALAATDREHVWKAASFYGLSQLMRFGRGVSLRTAVESGTYDIPGYAMDDTTEYVAQEGVPYVDAATSWNETTGELSVFVINRSLDTTQALTLDVRGFENIAFVEHIEMFSDDIDAKNTYENPDAILPRKNPSAKFEAGVLEATLQPLSWNVLRLARQTGGNL